MHVCTLNVLIYIIHTQFGRRLLISRTFCDEEGREYVRHEVVKNQAVIDGYIRLKTSRSKDVMLAALIRTARNGCG